MARGLIVYYSMTGHGKALAEQIARVAEWDLARIGDVTPRRGGWGYLRSTLEAVFKLRPRIVYQGPDPSGYDAVLVGGPVWAGSLASPVRAFLASRSQRIKRFGFFCTLGGSGADAAAAQAAAILRQPPVATLAVTDGESAAGEYEPRVRGFVDRVRTALQPTASGVSHSV